MFKDHFIDNKTVNSSVLKGFKKLDVIDLTSISQGSILELHTDISDIFVDLKHFYLKHNEIVEIKETLFQNLFNLQNNKNKFDNLYSIFDFRVCYIVMLCFSC